MGGEMSVQRTPAGGVPVKVQGGFWDIERFERGAIIEDNPQSRYRKEDNITPPTSEPTLQPVVFKWSHGGNTVFLVTSYDDWTAEHRLSRSRSDFTTILNLPPGIHWYKFIVDERWSCARDQPHQQEANGGYVNVVKVDFCSETSLKEDDPFTTRPAIFGAAYSRRLCNSFDQEFSQKLPPSNFFGTIPEAPAHLGRILLNKTPPTSLCYYKTSAKPTNAELEHIYIAQHVPNDVLTLGLTTRYREKTYTTIYYRTWPPGEKRDE